MKGTLCRSGYPNPESVYRVNRYQAQDNIFER